MKIQTLEYLDLKQIRKSKGLTLRQVEKISGISNSYLSQLERGLRIPSIDTLIRLAKAYEMDITELILSYRESPDIDLFSSVKKVLESIDLKNDVKLRKLFTDLTATAIKLAMTYDKLSPSSKENLESYLSFLSKKDGIKQT